MKKFYCLLGAVAMVAVATTVFAKITHEKALTQMALVNIEALSQTEHPEGEGVAFEFNGQTWWGIRKNSGSSWFPQMLGCDWGTDKDGKPIKGKYISCWTGEGNCWNGTSCIKN